MVSLLKKGGTKINILAVDRYNEHEPNEEYEGCNVFWYKKPYTSGNKISFLSTWINWWIWVIGHLFKRQYDIVHMYNLESVIPGIIGRWIFRKKYKLIFDVRDPWGMTQTNPQALLMRLFKVLERWAASNVDGLLLSQGRLGRTGKYFGSKICRSIPTVQVLNVPDTDLGKDTKRIKTNKIRINFSGHISYARNAQAILDLAHRRPETVEVDVVGHVRDKKLLKELSACQNVKLYGYLPFDQAMNLIVQANLVSILYDTKTEIAIVASANKMFEAMMLSRPYIASQGGFPGAIATKHCVGFSVPYGDSEALIAMIDEIHDNPFLIERVSDNARKCYLQYFRWEVQRQNIAILYEYLKNPERIQFQKYEKWSKLIGTFIKRI